MAHVMALRTRNRLAAVFATVALVAGLLVAGIGVPPAGAAPGPATDLAFAGVVGNAPAGTTWSPTVTVLNASAQPVTGSTSQIYLHLTPGTGGPGAAGASVHCDTNPVSVDPSTGVASFTNCHVDRVGTGYTVTAEDPTLGLSLESAAFNVVPNIAAKLAFTTQPGYGTLNQNLSTQPKVSIEDAFGNVRTSDTDSVVLAKNTGPGNLTCPTSTTTVAAVAGVATFAGCQLSLAGSYTLKATSGTLASATSVPFNVSDAAATQLVFLTQPGTGQPGHNLSILPVLAFEDANNRIVTTENRTVSLAITPGTGTPGAVLNCLQNPAATTNGLATFAPTCQINLVGTGYTLTATSSAAVLTATSAPVAVGLFHLVFTTQPGDGIAGGALSTQPVVTLEDTNNQIVDSGDLVSLTITSGTGTPGAALTCDQNPVTITGVAAFADCHIDRAGTAYTLTADDTAAGVTVVSTPFNVVGPATKLVFTTQPGDSAVGLALNPQPVVAVEDALGNVLTSDNTTVVTLTKASGTPVTGGPGTLTCPPVTVVKGSATFPNCSIDTVGTGYRLTATSNPKLTPTTSDAFNIAPLQRIFGPDAIDTSIAISKQEFPKKETANAVVLARSDFFSDALAGGPLAAVRNAPLLITPGASLSATLDTRVQAEIQRVLPTGHTVYILGGPLALASGIDSTLQNLGYTPVRVAGDTLYGTAVAIAGQLGNPSTVFEATGLNFPDALSSVPAAIQAHGAILLTNGTVQAPETAAYLAAHPPTLRYAIGGPLAAAGADPSATAVYGQDLYGTSAAVASTFFPHPAVYGVATGVNYPDALSGGVFMATGGRLGPVLLVDTHTPLPPTISTYLATLPHATPGFVFGGPLAVGDDVLSAIAAIV